MSVQTDLFDRLKPNVRVEDPRTIREQFAAFHEVNPSVYAELVDLARQAKRRGRSRLGIGHLWEVLRWQRAMATTDPTGLKLNNNYRSHYARLIATNEPDLADIFEMRELRSA